MAAVKQRPGDQRLPEPNGELSCQESFLHRVEEDMPHRMKVGLERYGTLLQPFNKRDFMQDAWEELMDLSVYLEGIRRERQAMIELLHDVVAADKKSELGKQAKALLKSIGQWP